MRSLLIGILAVLAGLSAVALTLVRPERASTDAVIEAYLEVGDDPAHESVRSIIAAFREEAAGRGLPPFERPSDLLALPASSPESAAYRAAFEAAYEAVTGERLSDAPRLVWSTDANPAREVQMALFRAWRLREFGEPVDITTDPSNRELTKSIVQSVAGAGPDIIEYIGPAELRSLVAAGIALDVSEEAERHGFGLDTVFDAARSSVAVRDAGGRWRQYAYPCNVGYAVLLYHRDLFEQAGEPEPDGGWTIDEMRRAGERVLGAEGLSARPRFAVMNVNAFEAALAAGGALFPESHGAYCVFDSPKSVAGLRAYRDLMYEHRAMPRPAEAASMSSGAAGRFGGDATGSAPGLFAQKSILMYVGGRWEYVTFAIANRDRVLVPAIRRRLGEIDAGSPEAATLRAAMDRLLEDVLLPLTGQELAAVDGALDDDDRRRLLHIGVAHVPTVTGTPSYSVAGRGALINRAIEGGDPERLRAALHFLRFLGSRDYNEQINGAFDSIAGRVDACLDANGVSGPPAPLPGLRGFDSPVFTEAMLEHGRPWRLSPYVGRTRLMTLTNEVLEDLQSGSISAEAAASEIEERINRQILANALGDARLRERWVAETGGVDPASIEPGLRDASGAPRSIRSQIEAASSRGAAP